MNPYLSVGSEILKNWDKTMNNIKENKNLKTYIIGSTLLIIIFGALFGAVLGLFVGNIQVLLNAIKIPILFIVSSIIALPVYYVMDALTGGKRDFLQITALLFCATALTTIILIGFVPILLLFIFTTDHYPTIAMLTVVICAIGGFYGIMAFLTGYKHIHDNTNWQSSMAIGSIVYMFAGTQFSWVLRPYLNKYDQFIRPPRGNFYVGMFEFINANPQITSMFIIFLIVAIALGIIFTFFRNDLGRFQHSENGKINTQPTDTLQNPQVKTDTQNENRPPAIIPALGR